MTLWMVQVGSGSPKRNGAQGVGRVVNLDDEPMPTIMGEHGVIAGFPRHAYRLVESETRPEPWTLADER